MSFFFSFLSSITLIFLVPDHVSQAKKGSVSNKIGVDPSFNQEYIFLRRVSFHLSFFPKGLLRLNFLCVWDKGDRHNDTPILANTFLHIEPDVSKQRDPVAQA